MNGNEASTKMMKLMRNFCMCYTSSVSQKKEKNKRKKEWKRGRKNGREEERMEERKKEWKNTFPCLFSTPN